MTKPAPSSCPDFEPFRGDGYLKWSMPAHNWSGAEYDEDTVILLFDTGNGEWSGTTEFEQCVKRDLDRAQIIEVCREFKFEPAPAKFYGDSVPDGPSVP